MNEKYIYVIFSATDLKIGKMIRVVTGQKYNHVSFALREDLTPMYAFSRRRMSAPIFGGFTEESPLRYKYKTKRAADIKICKLPMDEETYGKFLARFEEVKSHSDEYLYNTFAVPFAFFHRKFYVEKAYTCIEFVASLPGVKDIAHIEEKEYLSIADFENRLSEYVIFEGSFEDLNLDEADWGNDEYTIDESLPVKAKLTVKHIGKLARRM